MNPARARAKGEAGQAGVQAKGSLRAEGSAQ